MEKSAKFYEAELQKEIVKDREEHEKKPLKDDKAEDIRHTTGSKELYMLRSQTIEQVFADAKELHGMRYAKHRGLDRMKMELNLLFVCMNLKKLANKLWKNGLTPLLFRLFMSILDVFAENHYEKQMAS